MTMKKIPLRYFEELLTGSTVPRFDSNGEPIPFRVGWVGKVGNGTDKRTAMTRCTQNCPYHLVLIK